MKKQNYKNHRRVYPPHHLVFYPLMALLSALSTYRAINQPNDRLIWVFILVTFVSIAWLSFMLRQHYALTNQDRIVRLEFRLRYYQLTGGRFEPYEQLLSFKQIAALRYASDSELPALLQKTIEEKLSPSAIKQMIVDWQPDLMRV